MSDDLLTHHRKRTREAEREAVAYKAENRRSTRLLALALRAAAGDDSDPLILLRLLAAIDGTDLARPAWVEEKERSDRLDAELQAGQRFLTLIHHEGHKAAA